MIAPVLAGCLNFLGPAPSGTDDPPWTLEIDTTFQVCRHNHDRSRRVDAPCNLRWADNATFLPNGTPATGPDIYLKMTPTGPDEGDIASVYGYDDYPREQFDPPSWNYTEPCGMWSPGYGILAEHNRCDNHTVRGRVVPPPQPTSDERARLRANDTAYYARDEVLWEWVYPFDENGHLNVVLHRPRQIELEVRGEYPEAYKQHMRDPGWCDEQVPPERRDQIAAGARGDSWVWSMDGDVRYAEANAFYGNSGRFQRISNEVVVTGDAELTLAWRSECIGGQY